MLVKSAAELDWKAEDYGRVEEGRSSPTRDHADYWSTTKKITRGPQGNIKTHAAGHVLKAHFHTSDQFQIFVRGGGKLGNDAVVLHSYHYADAFQPYGPIVCGPETLTFAVLRSRPDRGNHKMPESQGELSPRDPASRYHFRRSVLTLDGLTSTKVENSIPQEPDGLMAKEIAAPAGATLDPETIGGSGRFAFVLEGSLIVDGKALPPESLIWAYAGESFPVRKAGPEGVHLLDLQLPRA